jgi:hypothetical protein
MGGKELGIKLFLVVETMSPKAWLNYGLLKRGFLKRLALKTFFNFYQPNVDHI